MNGQLDYETLFKYRHELQFAIAMAKSLNEERIPDKSVQHMLSEGRNNALSRNQTNVWLNIEQWLQTMGWSLTGEEACINKEIRSNRDFRFLHLGKFPIISTLADCNAEYDELPPEEAPAFEQGQ